MKDVRLGDSLGSFHGAKTGCLEKAEEDQNSTGKKRQGQVQDSGAEKHSRKQKRMKTMKVIRTDSRSHGGGGGCRAEGLPGDSGAPGHFLVSPGSANSRLFPLFPDWSRPCQPLAICNRYNVLVRCRVGGTTPGERSSPS